ncbi:hypothetical protein [Streptomyces iconiensis]|uniref:DUF4231 domain-containing protein n=1 Tax=Streptomyces iconiensis TaxID=1384038 RepID=A0ABT7A8W4_9ACTN|nr:hypothetical protein [Streptomyces iconiensis]MDJ1137793.1 hypothetical protein [Streptomyces iconiensis]
MRGQWMPGASSRRAERCRTRGRKRSREQRARESRRQDQRELLALLLKEYECLRREIDQRITARSQLIGFIGAVAVVLSGAVTLVARNPQGGSLPLLLAVTTAGVVVLAMGLAYWWAFNKSIVRLGGYLSGVEAKINELSLALYGEVAVEWETRRAELRARPRSPFARLVLRVLGLAPQHRRIGPTPLGTLTRGTDA